MWGFFLGGGWGGDCVWGPGGAAIQASCMCYHDLELYLCAGLYFNLFFKYNFNLIAENIFTHFFPSGLFSGVHQKRGACLLLENTFLTVKTWSRIRKLTVTFVLCDK